MKVQLSFVYEGPLNEKLDERLRWLAEEIGFEWYGQGTHLETGRRDLAFSAEFSAFGDEVVEDLLEGGKDE